MHQDGYQPRHARPRSRRAIAIATAATVTLAPVVAVLATTAPADAAICPSAATKCFRVDVAPSSFVAGASVKFTITITNEAPTQTLGSSNIDAPAGYTLTHSEPPSSGSATLVGNEIQLRNMNLPPGSADVVTVTADTPVAPGAGAWVATAKQSNDYNGTGNDFVLDPNSSATTTATSGSAGCAATDVSCGTNFIRFDRANTVSTGSTTNSTVWMIGKMSFPATNATGGTFYSMEALADTSSCPPLPGQPNAVCHFNFRIDDVPAPYDANHAATLSLQCDQSHCNPNGVPTVVKQDKQGNVSVLPACSANVFGQPCVSSFGPAQGGTALGIVISNITAGDPSFAGYNIP